MSNTIQKRCRDCGTDVANQKRTKDAAGNYYCQPCYATRTKSPESAKDSPVCTSCGAAIIGDAAFCGRCGAKRDGHMSVDESIDTASLVGYLGKYGEYSEALSMVPALTKQMLDAIEIARSRRDQGMLLKIDEQAKITEAQTEATTKDCEEVRSRLAGFDQEQVRKVRDLILANESVSSGVKTGLRYDALGLFGQPKVEASPTAPEVGTRSPHVTRAPSSREVNLRNGIISVGIFIAAVLVGIGTNNMIANSASIENENTIRSWAMPVIGPGTGIAPFRAFLQERAATEAKGRNWLFFGDQRSEHDFLYRDELEAMRANGLLTRLDLAFSRDLADKVYVQHRMAEYAAAIWSWLEDGAHFYVCGDAKRMAKDVDDTLKRIVIDHGGMTAEAAGAYVKDLAKNGRYQRDVY